MQEQESVQLKKLLNIFFLGQLVGLPTLHSILQHYDISSNKHQIDYKELCKKLTYNNIHRIFESVFEQQLLEVLDKMSQKDSSCWSRELVTALLDDSVLNNGTTVKTGQRTLRTVMVNFLADNLEPLCMVLKW